MLLPPDLCLLVADYGIGDHYIAAGFAAAIRGRYGVRTWLAGKPHLAFLPELFPAAERFIQWPEAVPRSQLTAKEIKGGDMFLAHFPGLELMRAVGYGGFHFLDAYRCRFGLPASTPLSRPRPPSPEQLQGAAGQLRAAGLDPAATVLVSLEARSTPTTGVGPAFWSGLCAALAAAGLRPLINEAPGTAVPAGLPSLRIPLGEVRAVAQACAAVCSVRSGFSDLVSDLPLRHAVIYADVDYWAGPLLAGTTFSRYGWDLPPREFVVTEARRADRISEIAEFLAAGYSRVDAGRTALAVA
jgi:hypothetical protein